MADVEINDLAAKATPLSTDEIEVQATSGGASAKATLANVTKGLSAATLTAQGVVEQSTSAENVTGTADDKFPSVLGAKEIVDTHSTLVVDTSPQLGGDLDANGNQIQWSKGADVASATALPVLTDGNYFDVTGTTTITSINATGGAGTLIKLHFDGILTLTHDATDLILPGAANITTAAGDEFEFTEYAAGDYRCTGYALASGQAIVGAGTLILLSSVTASASSTVDFDNLLDSTFKSYMIIGSGVRPTDASRSHLMLVGTGAGPTYLTADYDYHTGGGGSGGTGYTGNASASTSSWRLNSGAGTATNDTDYVGVFRIILNIEQRPIATWDATFPLASGVMNTSIGGGGLLVDAVVTSVRFQMNAGTIATGTYSLYGITQ